MTLRPSVAAHLARVSTRWRDPREFTGASLALLASLSATGCASAADKCENFPGEYKRIEFKREEVSLPQIGEAQIRALYEINDCYLTAPFNGSKHTLLFEGVLASGGRSFMMFSIYGTLDMGLAFEIDKSGKVIKSFQYRDL